MFDPYDVLGIPHDATEKEIKTAYRQLARHYHPDSYSGDDAQEQMSRINKAYEMLRQHNGDEDTDEEILDPRYYSFDAEGGMEEYSRSIFDIFQRPVFRRTVLLLLVGSIALTSIVVAFFQGAA